MGAPKEGRFQMENAQNRHDISDAISAQLLLADRGCDTNEIVQYAIAHGMKPVIAPKRNRLERRD